MSFQCKLEIQDDLEASGYQLSPVLDFLFELVFQHDKRKCDPYFLGFLIQWKSQGGGL